MRHVRLASLGGGPYVLSFDVAYLLKVICLGMHRGATPVAARITKMTTTYTTTMAYPRATS